MRALPAVRPYAVTLSVGDLDVVAAWYAQMLGFVETDRKAYPEFGTRLVFLERDGFRVELISDERAEPALERPDPPDHTRWRGMAQFALQVDDIEAAQAALAERGARFAWTLQRYPDLGLAFFFVRDPEGVLVQFIQRLDGRPI